jgi:dsRNA-specific ribonuclease
MEHKGIQYQVVQTANPTGFKWTVKLNENKTRTGISSSKRNAIFQAVRFIERALRERAKAK